MTDQPSEEQRGIQPNAEDAAAPCADRMRRWRMALGVDGDGTQQLNAIDARIDAALAALYEPGGGGKKGRGGLGASAPRVSRWLGDIREYFPSSVVQLVQRDAFERLGLKQMLTEPEFLAGLEPDVHLVADLVSLGSAIPEKTKDTARQVVAQVVEELMERLAHKTAEAIRGVVDRTNRTSRPRFADIDWPRTIGANLRHYQPEYRTVVPERLIGFQRKSRRMADLEEVILCVDQSGSMATSVVYSSIFAAVMASLPGVDTKLVCFDTAIVDLTEMLQDPVDVLFGVQLGGGTDIDAAVAYCEGLIRQPTQAHLVLITDLYEGGNQDSLVGRIAALQALGVNIVVLLALSDDGKPFHDEELAGVLSRMAIPVFGCTPDKFPELMAAALDRQDLIQWHAESVASGSS